MAGLIAMISVFFVVSIEMFFSIMNGGSMGGCHGGPGISGSGYEVLTPTTSAFGHRRTASVASNSAVGGPRASMNRSRRRSGSIGHQLQRIELQVGGTEYSDDQPSAPKIVESDEYEDADDSSSESETTELRGIAARKRSGSQERGNGGHRMLSDEQQQKKNLLQVMLLEAGILFHSVFFGMALSVATGSNFIVLLIAITFHRTPRPPPPSRHALTGCRNL